MDKTKEKKVRVPSGIRNKLLAAVAMLLVSSIMVVSTTYAWFTLSTAPEVTGITTSVGANGNLEMALLDTTTYANLNAITSAVGDSSAVKGVTNANITWGNLVDLAEETYGLQSINLQPSRLNFATGDTGKVVLDSLLKTPVYGKDGRVVSVSGTTYASGTYSAGKWLYNAASLTYGVRAIGANDNLTPQEAGLIAAKAAYNSNLNSAKATIQKALSANGSELASAVTTLAMNSTGVTLTGTQKSAITAMIAASETALNYIDAAYKQVLLAAVSTLDATAYNAAVSAINDAASYSAAVSALTGLAELSGSSFTVPDYLTAAAATLETQKTAVSTAKGYTTQETSDYKAALNKLVDTTKVTVNGYKVGTPNVAEGETYDGYLMGSDGKINSTFMNKVISDGGAIVEMPDGSGVFAYIGSVAGNYSAGCKVTIEYQGLTLNNMNATMKTTATVDQTIGNGLKTITANGTSTGATALSDTYGYALDFAFRTNAASSYLQLQTKGAQRVYADSESTATMGGGSTMTFQSVLTDGGAAVLKDEQIVDLMGAIRVAFIDPTTGTIYGIASLDNIAADGAGFTGELTLKTYTVDPTSGKMTLTALVDDPATLDKNESVALMSLLQSTAVKLTTVVWLDGDYVDNGDVANAAQSLTGSMNLQFSSSAKLQPMQNSALNNMVLTYTEVDTTSGYYELLGTVYKMNTGYKVYTGNDGLTYFSNDETNYTKLTSMSAATAMTPVTASVSGPSKVTVGSDIPLTASLNGADITRVVWTSSSDAKATVTEATTNTATVHGVAVDAATIKAVIHFTVGGADKSIEVTFPVTIEAAPVTP